MRSIVSRCTRKALFVGAVLGAFCAPAAAFGQTVGDWRMDEPEGASTMVDSSSNGFDGALHGAVTTGRFAGASGVAGDLAYQFNDGTSCSGNVTTGTGYAVVTGGASGVSTPSQPTFNPGTQAFTVSAWVKTTAKAGGGICDFDLIRKGSSWKVEIFPFNGVAQPNCIWKGKLNGTTPKVALHALLPAGGINDGTWHQITCARTASGEALIVDGRTLATSGTNVGSISNKANVFVGAQQAGADFYIGLLDDVEFSIG